jgi:hypothetical protein
MSFIGSEITKIAFWNQIGNNNGTKTVGGTLEIYLTKNAGAMMKAPVHYPVAQQAFIEFVARAGLGRMELLTIRVYHDLNIYELVPGRTMEVEYDRVIFYGSDGTGTGRYKYDPPPLWRAKVSDIICTDHHLLRTVIGPCTQVAAPLSSYTSSPPAEIDSPATPLNRNCRQQINSRVHVDSSHSHLSVTHRQSSAVNHFGSFYSSL